MKIESIKKIERRREGFKLKFQSYVGFKKTPS